MLYQIEQDILKKHRGQARFFLRLIKLTVRFFFSLADLTGQFLPWLCAFIQWHGPLGKCAFYKMLHILHKKGLFLDTLIALEKGGSCVFIAMSPGKRPTGEKQLMETHVRLVLHRLSASETKKQTIHTNSGQTDDEP